MAVNMVCATVLTVDELRAREISHGGDNESADETDRFSARQSREHAAQKEMGS